MGNHLISALQRIFMFAEFWFKINCDLLCHHFVYSLSLDTNLTSRRNTGKPSQSASRASTSGAAAAAASKAIKQSANTNTSSVQAAASINGHMKGCNMYMMLTSLSRCRYKNKLTGIACYCHERLPLKSVYFRLIQLFGSLVYYFPPPVMFLTNHLKTLIGF